MMSLHMVNCPKTNKNVPSEPAGLKYRDRFLKGGINYTRYNSYSRDKSPIIGITTRNKNGFSEALFILGIAIPGIRLLL